MKPLSFIMLCISTLLITTPKVYAQQDNFQRICTGGGRWECFDQKRQKLALQIAQTNRRMGQLNPYNKSALLVAHKSWEQFIQDDCEYHSTFSPDTLGSGYGNMYAECMYKHHVSRLKELQKIEKWLQSLKE